MVEYNTSSRGFWCFCCGVGCGREMRFGVMMGWCGMWSRIGCGTDVAVGVIRGRGRHHNHKLEDLRHKWDAGNGQKGGVVFWQ